MTPTKPTCPPGRLERIARSIDFRVPTGSITECAPKPTSPLRAWLEAVHFPS